APADPLGGCDCWEHRSLDGLAVLVGSRSVLASLDATPLPDEEFDPTGIAPEALPAAEVIVTVVDELCDRFFDTELRTAARRLLAQVAVRSGKVIRRGRHAQTAAGIVWLAATANGAFERHGVSQREVREHLGLASSLSSR